MARKFTTALTATAMIMTQGITPLAAQTRPAPLPVPVEPTPSPQPVRPTPLPVPIPGGPQIQPPRPGTPGGPQIQPPRPGNGGPQIQPPRPGNGGPQIQPPRPTYPERPEIQPPRPPYPGNGGGYYDGYAGQIRCDSKSNKTVRCNVRTDNRVALMEQHKGSCTQGRSWGYDRAGIWVSRGCRATFAYGYGDQWEPERPDKDKGPSTGLIIGGVIVAGGLIALLASKNKKKTNAAAETSPTYPAGPPASLTADLNKVPGNARPQMQLCLREAARQVGVTGGTQLNFDKLVHIQQESDGWSFHTELTGGYPDGKRAMPMYCRTTPTKVTQLDFTN